ncbi:MAG: hypothetical protein R3B58_03630 [Phycisphaerales bacterium]
MTYKLMVITHLMGSALWIGGHMVLLFAIIPYAFRTRSTDAVVQFERQFGPIGLAALGIQVVSGLWLAHHWIGSFSKIIAEPTMHTRMIAAKMVVLILTICVAAFTQHRVVSRLSEKNLQLF